MPPQKNVFRDNLHRHPRRNVAVSYDWQGKGEDELTFLFAGATEQMLQQLFSYLCADGKGVAEGFTTEEQHPPRMRRGYVWNRLAVRLTGYRRQYASVSDLLLLIEARLRTMVNGGNVDIYDLDDFLNLADRAPKRLLTPADAGDPAKAAERQRSTDNHNRRHAPAGFTDRHNKTS